MWSSVTISYYCLQKTDQGSNRDWKTWRMKMVMEKSWNMKNWPKVMEICDSVMEFCDSVMEFCDSVMEFLPILPQMCVKYIFFWSPLRF